MTTTNFLPGQRVRFLATSGYNAPAGSLATVGPKGIFVEHKWSYVDIVWDGEIHQSNGGYNVKDFELVVEEVPLTAPAVPVTKIDKLKAHFLSGRSLTQLEAIGLYGAFRLAARVHDLKGQGWKIDTKMKEDPNGNPYAEYKLRSVKKVA